MRKVLITVAAAASALAIAAPASAQYYPAPQGPVHGYGNNYGHFRSLQARIDNLQRQINRLDKRDVIRNREADRLRAESRDIERQLRAYARNGLTQREGYTVERRLARLEQRIGYVLNDGHRWGRNDRRWNDFWSDRDRDGRNDRWEDDRGRRHD
jgi:hypothetical protein